MAASVCGQLLNVLLVACAFAFAFALTFAGAAEPIALKLRDQPVVEGQLVRVGDLVEVVSGRCPQTDSLLELPLSPSPSDGVQQTWTRADIAQHLELRGLHASAIRWMGAEKTQLRRGKPVQARSSGSDPALANQPTQNIPGRGMSPAFVQDRAVKQAEMIASQAISEFIALKTGERTDWRISLSVPSQFARALQVKTNVVSIGGGKEPWEGKQDFVLEVKDRGALVTVPIQATLQLPPMVVIANRALRRDEIITAEALDYGPLPRFSADTAAFFTDIEQLVGKQVRRSISTGLPVDTQYVGDAIVVERGELVEVESVAGDISVTTSGRASDSGAVGDLIGVELLPSHQRISASVAGPLRVRVSAVPSKSNR